MKKLIVALLVSLALVGCAGQAPETEPVDAAPVEEAAAPADEAQDDEAEAPADEASGQVQESDTVEVTETEVQEEAGEQERVSEVDLTAMSSTMVFAEVTQMTRTPTQYDGAQVTMRGFLMVYDVDPSTGVGNYSCLVQDATKCCQRGLAFTVTSPLDDTSMLVEGNEVIIRGTFEIYEIGGRRFVRIADCTIESA